jgi:amino-acid N-acetyltransferase
MPTHEIRKTRTGDVPAIKALVDQGAEAGALLGRSTAELYECMRDFHVYVNGGGVGGCCALHIDLNDLAEVRTLIVKPELRGAGIGAHLVRACLEEARDLGIGRVYALTRSVPFFQRLGFHEVDKHVLPHKVFKDCVRCPLFPDCDESAVMLDMRHANARETTA